jgi:DNA adenine methylase
MSSLFSPVEPVSPVAPYVGGKRALARQITDLISTIPHNTYAEPFVGMGGVFLRRRVRPKAEVINDWSNDVANLFRILQRHYVPFIQMMQFQIASRAAFDRLSMTDPDTLTDLERAGRFLYLQRLAFGGNVAKRTFGVDVGRGSRFDVTRLGPMLEDLHERLAGVTIERLPFDAFIARYDRPGTLFYCDPPYWGSEDYYGRDMFPKEQFERLAEILRQAKGNFIVSLNDVPDVRRIFSWANLETVHLNYTVGGGARPAREVIITRRP